MRENPDGFPSSRVRLRRRRCSHSGIRMGLLPMNLQTLQRVMVDENRVMAGGTPANPATLVTE